MAELVLKSPNREIYNFSFHLSFPLFRIFWVEYFSSFHSGVLIVLTKHKKSVTTQFFIGVNDSLRWQMKKSITIHCHIKIDAESVYDSELCEKLARFLMSSRSFFDVRDPCVWVCNSKDVIMTQLLCVGWDLSLRCLADGASCELSYIVSFHFRWEIFFSVSHGPHWVTTLNRLEFCWRDPRQSHEFIGSSGLSLLTFPHAD